MKEASGGALRGTQGDITAATIKGEPVTALTGPCQRLLYVSAQSTDAQIPKNTTCPNKPLLTPAVVAVTYVFSCSALEMIRIFNICQSPSARSRCFQFRYDPLFLNPFAPSNLTPSSVIIMNAMNVLNRYDLHVLEDGEEPCVLRTWHQQHRSMVF